jgi:pimeloyl-ACP methyl ester carboxylesterase
VPLLAIWGKDDIIFIPPGAQAFRKDPPNVVVEFVYAGHFALKTDGEEIAERLLGFLRENGI